MYDDAWYSYVPELQQKKDGGASQSVKHRRRESLLRQQNGTNHISEPVDPILDIYEEEQIPKGPPSPTLTRRAKSYSDFYDVARAYIHTEFQLKKSQDQLDVLDPARRRDNVANRYYLYEDDLLNATQEEYLLYRDQLSLSEQHLDNLLEDTVSALDLLATLSDSFKTVESQSRAFQAQCENLLAEQKRLRNLADEVGTNLQFYSYLEPLTRRLNAPGSGRLVKSDDFLGMLLDLNACIDFMDQHPDYRDSATYKTRYISLLERALTLIQTAFASNLREVTDEVVKQTRDKEHSETAEYALFYGKFESLVDRLGPPLVKFLTTDEFAFGHCDDHVRRGAYVLSYHFLFNQLLEEYIKSRQFVVPLVQRKLKKYATSTPSPETEFKLFSRRCVQYVLDICHNEAKLTEDIFQSGPLMIEYQPEKIVGSVAEKSSYVERLQKGFAVHITTLVNFLKPYLGNRDLHRVADLIGWLETMYMSASEGNDDVDRPLEDHRKAAYILLNEHLWPLSDSLFIAAAAELEHFKPTEEDLELPTIVNGRTKSKSQRVSENSSAQNGSSVSGGVSTAYPTVKSAIDLLILYNESRFERPKKGDVLYEIVHQTTESLQRAATTIKRTSGILNAQVFLIKNLILIENLFLTHEIPDSVRQSAELDFSPFWAVIKQLQDRRQLLNPLAYIKPLVNGELLPAVVDQVLDARKEMERVLVQQITGFAKYWQSKITSNNRRNTDEALKASVEFDKLLEANFEENTRVALWRMLASENKMADAAADLEDHGLTRTLKDLFAGAAGGIAQVLLGQPFDIVKVRLQTSNQYPNALEAAKSIWVKEGPLAFYKGTLTPLIGIGACVSVQFGAFHEARRRIEAYNISKNPLSPGLSYSQYYAAGAFAGVANSVISGPIEHVRIRLQTQPHGAGRLYNGPLDCVRKLSAHEGVLKGLYRGEAVTIIREAQAYGVWFLTFEYLMNADALRNKIDRKEIPSWKIAFYGGLAGEALWLASYPFDVVKSKMQSDGFGENQKYKGMNDCFRKTYKAEGIRGFWKGLGPTCLRAMPVSAGTFAVVEMTMRAIN
ncbi:hypothetical protein B7463_g7941, partial [Scytalidium lignicola]